MTQNLEGDGALHDADGIIAEVRYVIFHGRRMVDVGRGGEVPGLARMAGQIRAEPEDQYHILAAFLVGKDLRLELEDGRWWDCRLVDAEGQLVGRGRGLYRAAN